MKKIRPFVVILFMVLLVSIGIASATTNEVPVTSLGETSVAKSAQQFAPVECAGKNLTNIVYPPVSGEIKGTDSNDLILGRSSGNNTMKGGKGDDCIIGGGGNDTINGEAGDDVILGGPGNDTLQGGGGKDYCYGGGGNDKFNKDCEYQYP